MVALGRHKGVIDHRFDVHREVVRNIVVAQVGIDMGIDNLQDVESAREDDTQVAVTTVVVA